LAFGHDLPARATPSPRPGLHTAPSAFERLATAVAANPGAAGARRSCELNMRWSKGKCRLISISRVPLVGRSRHLSRRLIFNLDMGLDMKRALSGNGERLSTQIRALARQ